MAEAKALAQIVAKRMGKKQDESASGKPPSSAGAKVRFLNGKMIAATVCQSSPGLKARGFLA